MSSGHRRLKLLSKVAQEREEERYVGERRSKSAFYFTAFGLDLQLIRSTMYMLNMIDYLRVEIFLNNH